MFKLAAFVFVLAATLRMSAPQHFGGEAPMHPLMAKQGGTPPSPDCGSNARSLAPGESRVYIALRGGKDGSGASLADARDGSTVAAIDTILRCYSEGCADPRNPQRSVSRTENLIVCLGPGTFSTLGSYDYIVAVPHTNAAGFTVGKGWKIHGAGRDKTTVKLNDYLPNTAARNPLNFPVDTGTGLVFGTNGDGASGVEISDLTIDANYPELKSRARQNGVKSLTLEAIHLRSDLGGHWIHDVNVVNAAAEIGTIHPRWEAFPVWIGAMDRSKPGQNRGNIIENVSMTGRFGLVCTAIAVANATAEVRNNLVDGYQIGYGGWDLDETVFHDNTAINTDYGFNIDSLVNHGVRIESNRITHPRKYGIVVGGDGTYAGFKVLNNTLQIDNRGVSGFVFLGNVTGAVIAGNKVMADNASGRRASAIRSYSVSGKADPNIKNSYQSNQIAAGMSVVFQGRSKSQNCFFDNRDDAGKRRRDLPDNHGGPCVSGDLSKP